MMQKRLLMLCGSVIVALALSVPVHGALIETGGGLVYDDDLDVTWMQDLNYARTTGVTADGKMTWNEALNWVSSLVFVDSATGLVYDNWLLPADYSVGPGPCTGVHCSPSDFTHLYDDEGIGLHTPGVGIDPSRVLPFFNAPMWNDAVFHMRNPGISAGFPTSLNASLYSGSQGLDYTTVLHCVLPMHIGPGVAMPEAGTLLVFAMGLFGLLGYRRTTGHLSKAS